VGLRRMGEHIATIESFDTGHIFKNYKCMVCKSVNDSMITWFGVKLTIEK